MSSARAEPITIAGDHDIHVSGLLQTPPQARACYVLAHGAGAGMTPSVHGRGRRGARGARHRDFALSVPLYGTRQQAARPAAPRACGGARRGRGGRRALPGLPLIAGGKSFGGRMTSQAQAHGAAAGRARAGVSRLSAASGRQAVAASAPRISST